MPRLHAPRALRLCTAVLAAFVLLAPAAHALSWEQATRDIKTAAHETGRAIRRGAREAGETLRHAAHDVGTAVRHAFHHN